MGDENIGEERFQGEAELETWLGNADRYDFISLLGIHNFTMFC